MVQIFCIDDYIDISFFSKLTYADMARFVGLNPHGNMHDIVTFDLHRSRIPTSLFELIVDDMDILLPQYCRSWPTSTIYGEKALSRFLAPVSASTLLLVQ